MPSMRALRLTLAGLCAWSATAVADTPCEAPRTRDLKPLMKAVKEDRAMIDAYLKAVEACARPGDACDQARLTCGGVLTTTLNAQVSFDEGWWLRDMMLPYLGVNYTLTKPISIPNPLSDTTCNLDVSQLSAAAQRRNAQVERRSLILEEYPRWVKWANDAYARCKDAATAEASRAQMQRAEQERLALAAANAKASEEKRQKDVADAKRKAEDDERKRKEAEADAARKQKEAA